MALNYSAASNRANELADHLTLSPIQQESRESGRQLRALIDIVYKGDEHAAALAAWAKRIDDPDTPDTAEAMLWLNTQIMAEIHVALGQAEPTG